MRTIKASTANYGGWRAHSTVRYIVIHYTKGNGDTAENEGIYFSRPHSPKSSAHFFIGRDGDIVKSVSLDHVAYSVGGKKYNDCAKTGGGKYYRKCMNSNSVSIELCDNLKKDPSPEQIEAVKKTIAYIQKYCPNAKTIIRHFDVNGKYCPARMMDNKKWGDFCDKLAGVGVRKG